MKNALRVLREMTVLMVLLTSCSSSGFIPTPTSQIEDPQIDIQAPEGTVDDQVGEPTTEYQVYLPTISTPVRPFAGIIMPVYWSKENVAAYMPEVDALAGIKHTSVGWGIDVQDPALVEPWDTEEALNRNNLYRQLEQLWQAGYISFIKIGSSAPIRDISEGKYDQQLTQMAKIYSRWLENGGNRKAMFAPFQEMNGEWVPYYYPNTELLPQEKYLVMQQEYKDAYRYVLNIFQSNGVDRSEIWWVFSPNGGSLEGNEFEKYYPGDDIVDLVGFASYNYGFCDATVKDDGNDYGNWENYDRIYEPYIRRIEAMAPGKYILISETGSSALTSKEARDAKQYDYAMKAEWLINNYRYLASEPMVLGVYYFDFNDLGNNVTCDLAIPRQEFSGYRDALRAAQFHYLQIDDLERVIP